MYLGGLYFIEFVASRFYSFFAIIGKIATSNFRQFLTVNRTFEGTNPWNDFTLEFTTKLDNWLGDVLTWIIERVPIPADFTVLDSLLFIVAFFFVVCALVRLFSAISPD